MKVAGLLLLVCLISCSPEPKPLEYGVDKCAICGYTIDNTKIGGELVTVDGRVLRFGSIECLLKYYDDHLFSKERYTWIRVADYDRPGELINVNDAIFLRFTVGASHIIAVSKGGYSHRLTADPDLKGIYWNDLVWKYHAKNR
jgi:copper chaperone NosL